MVFNIKFIKIELNYINTKISNIKMFNIKFIVYNII